MENITQIIIKDGRSFFIDKEDELIIRGMMPWRINSQGYVVKSMFYKFRGTHLHLHRFILRLAEKNPLCVDHIDRNKLNNCKSNLRVCTYSQNLYNRPKDSIKKCYSIYKGVAKHKASNGWCVRLNIKGKEIWGGTFKSEIEAAKKANELFIKYHGEFACLNIIN